MNPIKNKKDLSETIDKIRNLAANKLGIKTAKFGYASNKNELIDD